MAEIRVESIGGEEFRVTVNEGGSTSSHTVRVTSADQQRFGAGAPAEALLEESFRFLLEREPKEAILSRFDLPVIGRYFPEYADEIRRRLG
jgi:hypothetical protein